MNKTLAVIFDMDGVICHTNPFHSEAFRQFFGKRGFIPSDEEFAEHMYGKSNSYIFSYFLKRTVEGPELKLLEEEKEGLFRELYLDHVTPLPGLPEFLRKLKEEGLLLGVATSAPLANLDMILDKLGFRGYFDSILASEDVSRHKPDPEVYLKSAANLGVTPSRCVVFEDSFSGISAGRNAGMTVVGVLSSHRREELPECAFYIDDYTQLDAQKIAALRGNAAVL